jgi:transposase-like protein
MKCIYCNYFKLYTISTTQVKCASCKRKFSTKKIFQNKNIINSFIDNTTINQCSKKLKLNYETIKNTYEKIRKNIAIYLEENYNHNNVVAYEEYIYIEKSKKHQKKHIFDAKTFICFEYENKVFCLLMPSLQKYKNQFLSDGADEIYYKELSKFLMFNKISKNKKEQTLIHRFLFYFEEEILKYKGISNKNFFYYLKEIEFKFNYNKNNQEEILNYLIINSSST